MNRTASHAATRGSRLEFTSPAILALALAALVVNVEAQVPGRNVIIVSRTSPPGGDPFLLGGTL